MTPDAVTTRAPTRWLPGADDAQLRPDAHEQQIIDDQLLVRERQRLFSAAVVATINSHPWVLVDWLLERHDFLFAIVIRVIIDLLVIPCLVWMKIGRNNWLVVKVCLPAFMVVFGLLGPLVAQAEHYSLFVLRFSVLLWTSGARQRWTWPTAACTYALLLTMFCVSHVIWPPLQGPGAYYAALVYLVSVALFMIVKAATARREEERALLLALRLRQRNEELANAIDQLGTAQARLVEQEKLSALGRLLSGLSHEINNPVNVILGSITTVRRGAAAMTDVLRGLRARAATGRPADDVKSALAGLRNGSAASELDEAVDDVELSSVRLRNIHRELRAFVRGDVQRREPTDLVPGLLATVGMIRRSAPPRIEWRVSADAVPAVLVNPGQANQIFFNLLQNAVDALGESGLVEVSTVADDERVKVVISDTGPGIAASLMPRIFEPFFTTKPLGKGTGLGLAISRELAQRNGGTVELEPSGATGARFSVTLPRARDRRT